MREEVKKSFGSENLAIKEPSRVVFLAENRHK
jgi:hypothetical protein